MYTRMPVVTQIISTDVRAPITSARYQPNDILLNVNGYVYSIAGYQCWKGVQIIDVELDNVIPVIGIEQKF